MADLAAGFDRADGVTIPFGTVTPAGSVTVRTAGGLTLYLEEDSDSPQVEYGEQLTFSHSYTCDIQTAYALLHSYHRGLLIFDTQGNTFQVLSVQTSVAKPNYYKVKIVSECVSSFTPPDEFSIEPAEFNPSIFLNPFFSSVVNYVPTVAGEWTGYQIAQNVLSAANANDVLTRQVNYGPINATTITNPQVLALAQTMVQVLALGADSFYLAGWKVTWSQYSFSPPGMNPGGYIEDPVTQGGLPWYFWSADGSQSAGSNILTQLASTVNPTFYSGGFSWLRFADSVQKERTWFRINHSWVGGPLGRWQPSLYPPKVTH